MQSVCQSSRVWQSLRPAQVYGWLPLPRPRLCRCLLALHVLGVADPRLLLLDSEDPQGLVRRLAPYVKVRAIHPTLTREEHRWQQARSLTSGPIMNECRPRCICRRQQRPS